MISDFDILVLNVQKRKGPGGQTCPTSCNPSKKVSKQGHFLFIFFVCFCLVGHICPPTLPPLDGLGFKWGNISKDLIGENSVGWPEDDGLDRRRLIC